MDSIVNDIASKQAMMAAQIQENLIIHLLARGFSRDEIAVVAVQTSKGPIELAAPKEVLRAISASGWEEWDRRTLADI